MFSGIVEEIGTVENIVAKKNLSVLNVRAHKVLKGTKPGSSISVDGVCLTVTEIKQGTLCFDVMRESLLKTTLGNLKPKSQVNLERALKANDRIDGHFVTGHVDSVGMIQASVTKANYAELRIHQIKGLEKYIVPKGSICLDGVSLTVGEVKKNYFSIYLIPFTRKCTVLGMKKKGDAINVETDILAKYILSKNSSKY
jgi:riboflavin synthase